MPRTFSPLAENQVNIPARGEVWVFLIEIDHASLSDPIRLVNNDETLVVNGLVYLPVGVQVAIPDENPDELPQVQMAITDVDRAILTKLRDIPTQNVDRPTVSTRLVLTATPESVEAGPFVLDLLQHTRDRSTLKLTLGTDNIVRRPFPAYDVLPQFFSSLF